MRVCVCACQWVCVSQYYAPVSVHLRAYVRAGCGPAKQFGPHTTRQSPGSGRVPPGKGSVCVCVCVCVCMCVCVCEACGIGGLLQRKQGQIREQGPSKLPHTHACARPQTNVRAHTHECEEPSKSERHVSTAREGEAIVWILVRYSTRQKTRLAPHQAHCCSGKMDAHTDAHTHRHTQARTRRRRHAEVSDTDTHTLRTATEPCHTHTHTHTQPFVGFTCSGLVGTYPPPLAQALPCLST